MAYLFSAPAEEQALAVATARPDLERALDRILQLQSVVGAPEHRGHSMFCPGIDQLIPVAAARLRLPDVPLPPGEGDTCIVASEFYAVGGHSKVAAEISDIIGRERIVAILTDAWRRANHLQMLGGAINAEPVPQRARLLLGATSVLGKVAELYNLLLALRPGRIFLMAHHMDVIALVALWPFRHVVEYVHHADHLPTLGATLPFGRHIDLTWTCHQACRSAGIDAHYAGLGAPEIAALASRHPRGARLRIATCGQRNKYRGGGTHRWVDYALAALEMPGAELLHIGPTDDGLRREISAGLASAGIDPARYVYLGAVRDLATALIEHEVDVYLGSYPEAGGKATLEAMAAGLRPILPADPAAPPLLRLTYPKAAARTIAAPAELAAAVGEVTRRTAADVAAGLADVREEAARFASYVRGRDAAMS